MAADKKQPARQLSLLESIELLLTTCNPETAASFRKWEEFIRPEGEKFNRVLLDQFRTLPRFKVQPYPAFEARLFRSFVAPAETLTYLEKNFPESVREHFRREFQKASNDLGNTYGLITEMVSMELWHKFGPPVEWNFKKNQKGEPDGTILYPAPRKPLALEVTYKHVLDMSDEAEVARAIRSKLTNKLRENRKQTKAETALFIDLTSSLINLPSRQAKDAMTTEISRKAATNPLDFFPLIVAVFLRVDHRTRAGNTDLQFQVIPTIFQNMILLPPGPNGEKFSLWGEEWEETENPEGAKKIPF